MIKGLRKKFVIVAMSSTIVVLTIIMGIMNVSNYLRMVEKADRTLSLLVENDGKFPEMLPNDKKQNNNSNVNNAADSINSDNIDTGSNRNNLKSADSSNKDIKKAPNFKKQHNDFSVETPFETRYFTVTMDNDGNVKSTDTGRIAAISSDEAEIYGKKVYGNSGNGFQDIYRYNVSKESGIITVTFVDCRKEIMDFRNVLYTSLQVSALGVIAVFILVLIFSKIVFKPVAESYEKQKRFITDASHELKTPLTIIDANTEVMEMECGENQWSKSTKNQVERLTYLVGQLVTLTKLDEGSDNLEKTEFSLSDAAYDIVYPFETVVSNGEKTLILNIADNIKYKGDEKAIRQLISILMDNAVKYSSDNGIIRVNLSEKGKKIILSVFNETDSVEKGKNDILFERFYRTDKSRNSKTGGTGIGLSIAKGIVQNHKGKINAFSEDGKSLQITVELQK